MFFDSNYFGFIRKNSGTAHLTNKSKAAGIGVDSADSYRLKFNKNGTIVTVLDDGGSGVGVSAASAAEVVTATNVITAAESGKTFYLNSATEFVSTLPAPALGLKFTFIVTAAPSGADYTVVTDSAAQVLFGKVYSAAGDAGDVENTGGATTVTFVGAQSVVGDKLVVESDGTNWYGVAFASVAAGITFTG